MTLGRLENPGQEERRAARKLRAQLEPSEQLLVRLQNGLDEAAREESARDPRPKPREFWPRLLRTNLLL